MKKSYDLREISRAAGARQDEGIRQIKKGPHVVVLALGRGAQKLWEVSSLAAHDERACHNG